MLSRILPLLALSTLLAAGSASAQGAIEFGGFGTYTRFDESLGLSERSGGGARLSLVSGSGWSTFLLEGEGAYVKSGVAGVDIRYIPARVRLAYGFPLGRQASLLIGGGAVRNDYNDGDTSLVEYGYTALAGLRLQLGTFMALRLDAIMDHVANPINESPTVEYTRHQVFQAGLSFPLWSEKRPEPPRPVEREPVREPVREPAPAAQPSGPIIVNVPSQGAAPAPQPVQAQPPAPTPSYPDADNDGVPDVRDACRFTPPGSSVDDQGCTTFRDSDGDGMIDAKDACPGTAAGAKIDGSGCPVMADADRDGVADPNDACPGTAPSRRVDVNGCPLTEDMDRDGVADNADQCPATPPGTAVNPAGCPIPVAAPAPAPAPPPPAAPPVLIPTKERTITLRGVTFAPWKDDLTAAAMVVLDDVARQLIDASDLRLEIAGHTDAGGPRTRNITLSLSRAESVRAYLIMKGVPGERLVARGYGPDQPVASNATPSGRAMNRRVELRRVD